MAVNGEHAAGKGGDSLDAVLKETADLEHIPVEEVFTQLRCSKEGLSQADVEERLAIFGKNKLEEKHESLILKFLSFVWNPLSWVMEAAAIMALVGSASLSAFLHSVHSS